MRKIDHRLCGYRWTFLTVLTLLLSQHHAHGQATDTMPSPSEQAIHDADLTDFRIQLKDHLFEQGATPKFIDFIKDNVVAPAAMPLTDRDFNEFLMRVELAADACGMFIRAAQTYGTDSKIPKEALEQLAKVCAKLAETLPNDNPAHRELGWVGAKLFEYTQATPFKQDTDASQLSTKAEAIEAVAPIAQQLEEFKKAAATPHKKEPLRRATDALVTALNTPQGQEYLRTSLGTDAVQATHVIEGVLAAIKLCTDANNMNDLQLAHAALATLKGALVGAQLAGVVATGGIKAYLVVGISYVQTTIELVWDFPADSTRYAKPDLFGPEPKRTEKPSPPIADGEKQLDSNKFVSRVDQSNLPQATRDGLKTEFQALKTDPPKSDGLLEKLFGDEWRSPEEDPRRRQ